MGSYGELPWSESRRILLVATLFPATPATPFPFGIGTSISFLGDVTMQASSAKRWLWVLWTISTVSRLYSMNVYGSWFGQSINQVLTHLLMPSAGGFDRYHCIDSDHLYQPGWSEGRRRLDWSARISIKCCINRDTSIRHPSACPCPCIFYRSFT